MFSKSASTYVEAPPEAVFDYVADVKRHPEWAHERIEIQMEPGPERGRGARFSYVVHFMGKTEGKGSVVAEDRPRRFAYECEDKDGRNRWQFDLRPQGSGTMLTHSFERLSAPLWIRTIQPVLYPLMGRAMVSGGLQNIKAKVEASAPSAR